MVDQIEPIIHDETRPPELLASADSFTAQDALRWVDRLKVKCGYSESNPQFTTIEGKLDDQFTGRQA